LAAGIRGAEKFIGERMTPEISGVLRGEEGKLPPNLALPQIYGQEKDEPPASFPVGGVWSNEAIFTI